MSRVTAKAPYATTFRRKVRVWAVPVSRGVPLEVVQDVVRRDLNERKHTVVENSWRDEPGWYTVSEIQAGQMDRRMVSVRYVTGGMRHGMGERTELQPQVWVIEFARAHGPGFGR